MPLVAENRIARHDLEGRHLRKVLEQPEVRDVGSGEIGQALVLLAASGGELRAARGK